MVKKNSLWGKQRFVENEPVQYQFGDLIFWVKLTNDELWIANRHSSEKVDIPEQELEWQRWTFKKFHPDVVFNPVMPNLPVVVKPEYPFRVAPGVQTKIYVRIPLWVSIFLDNDEIIELPSLVLSKTWFGSFTDGELCYWITSSARKKALFEDDRPNLAVSPIHIHNRSDDDLLVDKLCHRVERLTLYQLGEQFWTNEIKVYFKGENDISEVEYGRKAPAEAGNAKIAAKPRQEYRRGLTAKTFYTIKDIAKLEFLHR